MGRDPNRERWPEVYRESPEVFARFAAAEDVEGRLPEALLARAGLAGTRVLELGAGTGRWTAALSTDSREWVAVEPAPGMLAIGRSQSGQKAHWLRSRGQALPFPANTFDRIFAGFVFANLRPRDRGPALDEVRRVLAPGGECWLIENHWEDDFQELRRNAGLEVTREIAPLVDGGDFELVHTVDTRMEFPSEQEAREVLGTILGPLVMAYLEHNPARSFLHRICLLRWRA